VELARAEDGKHHKLVEIRAAALDADLPADGGVTSVAAHNVLRFEDLATAAALLADRDADAVGVLFDRLRRPTDPGLDVGKLRHPRPQHSFGLVLGQPFVLLEIVGIDDFSRGGAYQYSLIRLP
jgi:hypothetical protein